MRFQQMFAFDAVHQDLAWPWVTFSADSALLAYATSSQTIATLALEAEKTVKKHTFTLPSGVPLGAFSIQRGGSLIALLSPTEGGTSLVTLHRNGESKSVPLSSLAGERHEAQAIAFDRVGGRIWVSLESDTETVLLLVDAATLRKVGELRSAALPRPSLHELHLHPQDDAVLLIAACGEAGTFARVAGYAGDVASSIPTELDTGGIAAGFVGFSYDGARVHLAEADELRTHAWPGLHELSTVPFADDFVSNFSGATLGHYILVDGEHADVRENAVMLFDRTGIRGALLNAEGPSGMWAGRLVAKGVDTVVTVESKGDPARACVWRVVIERDLNAN